MNWIVDEVFSDKTEPTAGGKARIDVQKIAVKNGFSLLPLAFNNRNREKSSAIKKIQYHIETVKAWENMLRKCEANDNVLIQLPTMSHSVLLWRVLAANEKKGVNFFAVVHDLESIRLLSSSSYKMLSEWRIKKEEISIFPYFKKIIVHNQDMLRLMNTYYNIPDDRMCSIEIFDYIYKDIAVREKKAEADVIIAGNLREDKSGYIYSLPDTPSFSLYGIGFDEQYKKKNVFYNGVFSPDNLPANLSGRFGLVWDGPSADTCKGQTGEYLRYNNPHKTSLYLAAGIPVIIWSEAAMAKFVVENKCGITINSLFELEEKLMSISENEYSQLKENAKNIGKKIKSGDYLSFALMKCLEREK